MYKFLVILLIAGIILPATASANIIATSFGPTIGMRIGSIQAVFGARGEVVVIPLKSMLGVELTTEFSIGEEHSVFNIGFHPKFRYPLNNLVPYAGMGFSIVHVFGLPEYADATDASFDMLAGLEWFFARNISLLGQVEGHLDGGDFADLEVGLGFHM